MYEKIRISKKRAKGEDGYKTFSIRIEESIVSELDAIALKSNRSRNEIINMMLEYCVNNYEIEES